MIVDPNSTIANTVEDSLVSPAHLYVVSEEQSIILSGNGQELTTESVSVQANELPRIEADSITVAHTAENSSPQTQGLRKRPLGPHPKLYRKNIRREQRAHGLPYTDAKGKMHAPRSLKPNPCIGKRCQNKCGLLWTEEARL